MRNLLLFVFVLLMYVVSGSETDESESVTVMEGDSVTLHTNLSELLNDDTILWMFGPKGSLISEIRRKQDSTSFFVADDVRFSGRLQVDQKSGSLSITNTRIRHSGQYKLTISREKIKTKTFSVTVISVANETDGVKSVSVTVMEGDSVTLHTNLSELLNDDTILWMFGPKGSLISEIRRKQDSTSFFVADDVRFSGRLQVDQKSGSLSITNTRIRHSGQYKLTISREKIKTKTFSVTVISVADETDGVKSVSVSEGDPVTLCIDAEIHKDALMLWRFGDQGILLARIDTESSDVSLNDADDRFRGLLQLNQNGSLTIKKSRSEHAGLYELQIRGRESTQRFLLSVNAVQDPGLSSGAAAGVVLVSVLLLAAAALALIYYRHKISKLTKEMAVAGEEKEETVMEGDSPTLRTGLTEINANDMIEWCYEAKDNCIAQINGETRRTSLSQGADGRFRSKLMLDNITGDLTISNVITIHSGLYKLNIISNSRKTKHMRFILTVSVKSVSVKKGASVLLQTAAEIQTEDLILWTFGAQNSLVVKSDSGKTSTGKQFIDRLDLNMTTGSLTIRNIRTTDSGHFKLQIINNEQTTIRRFNVTVTDSTSEGASEETTVVTPLLNGEVTDGGNEWQATSPV
uniref:Immunoglobulin domain-containing protein n=3 Tax=Cyprinus carpio TaxID=7962 RepID=A0A8C1X5X5_CYPCA